MNVLVDKNINSLEEIGNKIIQKYPNVRFLFEINFSRDDYLHIKRLFQQDTQIKNTDFKKDFFKKYFHKKRNYRISFLILIAGFIRYEYLNSENQSNFFNNFLRNILKNQKAHTNNFREALIEYLFRWRGNRNLEKDGLYIYDTQTSKVSLELEEAGEHKYLNSLIFHSGGVSEQDLKEYLKIIKYLANLGFDYTIDSNQLYKLYQNIDFKIYSSRLNKLFDLLNSNIEISKYIRTLILQSISIILNHNQNFDFKIPLYIRNYLIFIGKYGEDLEKININETDFLYENQMIMFSPKFYEIYKNINQISFKINNQNYFVGKTYDEYTDNDFDNFKIPIENIDKVFTIELFIDKNLFKRFEINLFKNNFILLNSNYIIKNITNAEIDIPKRDENKNYYIISKNRCINLKYTEQIKLKGYFVYLLPLDRKNQTIYIHNKQYSLNYHPVLISDIKYKDNKKFLYVDELPKFQLSSKDKKKFLAKNLFTEDKLDFETFYKYSEPIGRFEISIDNKIFNIIYIKGFKILRWFNWFDKNKIIKIQLLDKNIRVNSNEAIEKDNYIIHKFNLKEQESILAFNQRNGNNVHLKVLKPEIKILFLDRRKNEIEIKSKNIRYDRLILFKQLKIKLLNYPTFIKFDRVKILDKEEEVIKSSNNYFISIGKIKAILQDSKEQYSSLVLKDNYYSLPVTNIILNNFSTKNNKKEKMIKTNDINFILHNMDNIKYYFENKPYYIDGVTEEVINGSNYKFLIMREIRQTKRKTTIKKPFNSIEKDGLYVYLKDIDYE